MGKVTLQSIADRLGVSRMTVSNAFSKPDQLSAELRERVLAAADEMGYVGPDPAARALARGRTGSVGLLLTDSLAEAFEDEFTSAFLASVADALTARGLALTLLMPSGSGDFLPARDVAMDGALVYLCDPHTTDVAWLGKRGLPMVTVDQRPSAGIPNVTVDDPAGARAAAQHLLDLGHRRIGFLTLGERIQRVDDPAGEPQTTVARVRLAGWREVLDAAGVDTQLVTCPFRPPHLALDAARLLLSAPDRPTAVLCFSDVFADAVVRAAAELGLSVPDDISVVGYDDTPLAATSTPSLTTVSQDVAAKAEAAVQALTEVLAARRDKRPDPVEHATLPTRLVVRESTGPAPA
ncbi:LacI family DNA-binding transcriptional regulator [Nocardioides ferulae]|uniref:LacI family DNA-binding transcriptional regulator n=1 Tax=Nocardioides ferulae TaxID=2340821 RepID=UPI000EB5C7C8|nr:LacI family DNA-binding transcriptional regulator [Nocardioides ferulae]